MAGSPAGADRPPLRQLRTVADLIETPTLARIYAYAEREGPVTVADVVENLDVPQGTAYDYVERLEAAGLLERTGETRPREYDATPIALTLLAEGETRTVTPVLVAAIARSEEDDDLAVFVDRHGIDGLAKALDYAFEYVGGTVNHRIAARELDLSPLEAEVVLQALEPVVRTYADASE